MYQIFVSKSVLFVVDSGVKQTVAIKFCAKLGKTATEIMGMIQTAYNNDTLSQKCGKSWLKIVVIPSG